MKRAEVVPPEQREELIKQVDEAKAKDDLTVQAACDKVGVRIESYYRWQRGSAKGKRKYKKRKKQPTLVTSLVALEPETSQDQFKHNFSGSKMDAFQVADVLARMNAQSLRTLLTDRGN
jgi:hypothetical protein